MAALDHLEFDAVIGWAFGIRDLGIGGKEGYAAPIVWRWNQEPAQPVVTAPADVVPLTVIPNVTRTFQVRAFYDDGSNKVIGYYVPGASHPQDWEAEAAAQAPP